MRVQTAHRKKILYEKEIIKLIKPKKEILPPKEKPKKKKKIKVKERKSKVVFSATCIQCNTDFISSCTRSKFCGKLCKSRNENVRRIRKYVIRICEYCEEEYRVRSDSSNRFCGRVCGGLYCYHVLGNAM